MSIRLSTRHLALISSFVAATSALGSAPWSSDPAPESLVSPPDQDEADSVVRVDYVLAGGRGAYTIFRLDDSQKGVGFKFENPGGNRILPVRKRGPGLGPTREYEFAFKQRARQDIHLEVTDSPTDYFSDSMESYFYFFPRKVLPAIQWPTESGSQTFTVVLPTEERVELIWRPARSSPES